MIVVFEFMVLEWKLKLQNLLDLYESGDSRLLSTLRITQIGLLELNSTSLQYGHNYFSG